jgi:2-methylcitrate dehydratase PrpD
VHPLVLELTGKKTPQVGLEGKFSVYHSAAVAVIYGAGGEAEYGDEIVTDPKVMALRDRVEAVLDKSMHEDQARVTVRLKDGTTHEKFVEHAIGSLARPMSDAALETKFRAFAKGILSNAGCDRLVGLCWKIGELPDAGEVARASVPDGRNT